MRKVLDRLERPICRTVGCSSWFARFFEWPHALVCTKVVEWAHPEYSPPL